MKKSLFFPVLAFCYFLSQTQLSAQSKNEFKVGYGYLSGTEIGVSIATAIGTVIGSTLGLAVGDVVSIIINGQPTNVTITKIDQDATFWGTFYGGYNRYLTKRWSLGAQVNYNPMRIGNTVYYSNGSSHNYSTRADYLSLYARTDFNYVMRSKFQFYSGIMAGGLTDLRSPSDGIAFAAHVTLVGFRFGKKHALNTEFGLGLGPFLSVGYSNRF